MMTYGELSIPMQSLIQLGMFLCVCVSGCLIHAAWRRKSPLFTGMLTAAFLPSGFLLVIYTAESRADLRLLEMPALIRVICAQSVLLPVMALLISVVFLGFLIREETIYRRSTITRFSIKEGIDQISSGLCFYQPDGRVILMNSRMNALCHAIVGRDLQNAELFWQILSGGEVLDGIRRLHYGSYPIFRLPDGKVWSFAREELQDFIQLTAVDTTQQQALTDELQEKNLDLAAMNLRLRKYNENVEELARARERLETKVRIHGDLGQALLAARRYLLDPEAQMPPLDIWRSSIAMLRKEMETKKQEDPLRILEKAARNAGVELSIRGELPERAEHRQFFLLAASEALTNAVFHAGARKLNIMLSERENQWTMRFTNDGTQPEAPVTEGGGLGSLRRKAEEIGASMTVQSTPEYALTIAGWKG
jgi:signal transduction histidine kinase